MGHGSSNETAVKNGIAVAAATVRAHVPEVIAERVGLRARAGFRGRWRRGEGGGRRL